MSRASTKLLAPLVVVLLLGSRGARARDEFQHHLEQGVALYKKELYRKAIVEFQTAYELRPLPRLLYNVAQAYRKLGDATSALSFFERSLQTDQDQTPEERAEVRAYIAEMKALLGGQVPPASDKQQAVSPQQQGAALAEPGPARLGQPQAERRSRPTWRLVTGAAALVVGAGLAGVGIWALAVNDGCAQAPAAPGQACPRTYTSLAPGAGFMAAGSALLIGGAVLVALPGPRRSVVGLTPAGQGAGVTWACSF